MTVVLCFSPSCERNLLFSTVYKYVCLKNKHIIVKSTLWNEYRCSFMFSVQCNNIRILSFKLNDGRPARSRLSLGFDPFFSVGVDTSKVLRYLIYYIIVAMENCAPAVPQRDQWHQKLAKIIFVFFSFIVKLNIKNIV